ncbi:MAG: mechanosensitive ion channel [Deltaproteobacteria bacterium]|nr:mechanosensitive ion channel [Deltaproteobacteria bacterium]
MTYGSLFRQTLVLLLLPCFLLLPAAVAAMEAPVEKPADESSLEELAAPVVVDGKVLFKVRGSSAHPAEKRAQTIRDRIVAVAADPSFKREALRIDSQPTVDVVMAGNRPVMSVFDADARLEGIDRHMFAKSVSTRVGEAVDDWRQDRAPATLQRNALFALGSTFVLLLVLWGVTRLLRFLRGLLEKRLHQRIQDLQFRGFRIVRAQQVWGMLTGGLSFLWTVVLLTAVYLYLSSVLILFPWTRGLAGSLISLLVDPLRTLGLGFLQTVPKLAFLVVLFVITRYLLKLIRLYFQSIADGSVVLQGFDPEWSEPTYRLIRILLVAFMVIVAYPYIPGSGSEAFKGVSLFIGVLFSLGSSSLIGNLIAGYTMTYRRAFKIGDRIMVGSYMGDVEQVRLLVTYLRTPKNELVAIPNSVILNSEVVNYSTLAGKQGLILHTTVGIGYETPWRQVEGMLLEAAERTTGLLREPLPFVLHKALGDFCVTYEINAFCADPQAMNRHYTELHRNILDIFNEYGVQIMTPAYEGDPEQPKVVPREQWYAAPARLPESSATT